MERSKDDIISQLQEAVKMQNALIKSQNEVIAYWQDQAMMLLGRDIEATISRPPDGLPGEWLESADD